MGDTTRLAALRGVDWRQVGRYAAVVWGTVCISVIVMSGLIGSYVVEAQPLLRRLVVVAAISIPLLHVARMLTTRRYRAFAAVAGLAWLVICAALFLVLPL